MCSNFWVAQPLDTEKNGDASADEATFYYYDGVGTLYTSIDSGASFTVTYNEFATWHVPYFGLATPPRGTAAAGDIWCFAGWKLYHSTNAGANFSQVYQLYSLDHVFTLGVLPPTVSSRTGRDAPALAALCAARGAAAAAAAGLPPLPVPSAPAAYAVYAIGLRDYDTDAQVR